MERISKSVGLECTATVIMNNLTAEALFDTGAQVSIISAHQLEEYFPGIQIQYVEIYVLEGKILD